MASVTLTYPTSDGTRFAVAVGELLQLKDAQTPPQPRAATAAEVKAYFITRIKQVLLDYEGAKLSAAALSTVVVPPIDLT